VKIALVGYRGKVGSALRPALEVAGHQVTPIGREDPIQIEGHDAAINFTRPDVVYVTVKRSLEQGVANVVGTTGLGREELTALGDLAQEQEVQLFVAPNFAVGAVLMMRFAAEAGRVFPRSEIVELHNESKHDAPSGTAKATAALLDGEVPIHSVRLPGLVAHQEVLFGEPGALLTIRHDAFSPQAYIPGVLLALERLLSLPPGLTMGLETLLEEN
jgi:4-hydroxy-tetrahydrodipicolinate reductase